MKEADLEVQQELIAFGRVLSDLRQKSYNAKRKTEAEQREIEEKKELTKKKNEERKQTGEVFAMIDKRVTAMHKYEEFLEKVKNQYSDEFSEITDILNRYETLKRTNKELVEENQALQEELDKITGEAAIYEKEKGNEILGMNNSIAGLQKSLDKIEDEKNRKQRAVEDALKHNYIQAQQLSKLLIAVNNLYWMCKKDRKPLGLRYDNEGMDTDPFGSTKESLIKAMGQLAIIGQFMSSYKIIFETLAKNDKTHAHDSQVDSTKKNYTQTKGGTTH